MNYAALAVLVALGTLLVYRRQLLAMLASNRLATVKAEPKIGVGIAVDERYDNGRSYPPFIYLTTTIQNEGELAIRRLKGHWKLFSAHGVQERIIPINRDVLGSSPFQFQAQRINESGASDQASQNIRFNVDIQFEYFVPADDQPHQYSNSYEFDSKSRQMVPVSHPAN